VCRRVVLRLPPENADRAQRFSRDSVAQARGREVLVADKSSARRQHVEPRESNIDDASPSCWFGVKVRLLASVDQSCSSVVFCSVLFFSRPRSEGWPPHGRTDYFLHSSLSSVVLIDSSTESSVHVLMLSIHCYEHRGVTWCVCVCVLRKRMNRSKSLLQGQTCNAWTHETAVLNVVSARNVRRILVRGSMPPCRLRRRKV